MKNPNTEEIIKARKEAGLTQTQAAELVYSKCRAWQKWEAGDAKMNPAIFELFLIKTSNKYKP